MARCLTGLVRMVQHLGIGVLLWLRLDVFGMDGYGQHAGSGQ